VVHPETSSGTPQAAPRSDHPLVSIITPTKDRADLLEYTLRSVRNQTFRDLEHVVVDGGSEDGTVQLLERFEKTYELRWISRPDAGMYPAINEGLRLARGQILAYLNSDDLYFPWAVDVIVRAFRQHPDADFIFGDALAVDEQSGQQSLYLVRPFDLDSVRRWDFLAQPSVFWRRSAYEANGPFDETLRFVADCDYWMRAGVRGKFRKVNEFLSIERNHGGTLRASIGSPLWQELEAVRSRYVKLHGRKHWFRLRLERLRARLWVKAYYVALFVQSVIPSALRRGPWSRFMNSGEARIDRLRLLVHALPWVGRIGFIRRAVEGRILRPARVWLEPKA
jgi:glycosyltransferase involved in cell wall biosynthesis